MDIPQRRLLVGSCFICCLGKIRIPPMVANLTFGGPRRNRLFITATKSLYAVYVATTGVQTP